MLSCLQEGGEWLRMVCEKENLDSVCMECSNLAADQEKRDSSAMLALLRQHGYESVRCLGEGSSGPVWLVLYQATGELRVAKHIPDTAKKLAGLRLWAGLEHPGLAKIYDLLRNGQESCCIMEYIAGEDLRSCSLAYRKKYGALPETQAARWGMELCEILDYLHSRTPPIIYQDLKPSNIILTEKGHLKLIDPDSAWVAEKGGRIAGTPGFMAPEQQEAKGVVDERTDLYCLGRTLLWMSGGTEKGTVHFGSAMRRVLAKCTAREKANRFQNCRDAEADFRQVLNRKNRLCLLCCFTAVAVLGLGGVRISREEGQRREEAYRYYLSQRNISDYKSAIFLFPDREEGYQQFLNFILADGKLDRIEHQELSLLLRHTGAAFQQKREAYDHFVYRLGFAYWFSYSEEGGRRYAASWFEKLAGEQDADGYVSDSRERRYAGIFYLIWNISEQAADGKEPGVEAYLSFWEKSNALLLKPSKEESPLLEELCFWNETAGFLCMEKEHFLEAGITSAQWKHEISLLKEKERKLQKRSLEEAAGQTWCRRLQEKIVLLEEDNAPELQNEKG